MAVVIKPPENRAVMAKPPPKKLDADAGERVRKEEQNQWSGECSASAFSMLGPLTYHSSTVRDPFFSMTLVRKLGKRWKSMAKQ